MNIDHYEWKFNSIENKKPSFEYSAFLNDEIVGYYAAIPYRYSINKIITTAGMVCDIMVAKNVRGQSVFTQLGNYSIENLYEEGLNFITGNPIRPEVIPGHKKNGWEDPFILPMYGKFLSIKSFFISKRYKKIFFFFDSILRLWNWVLMLNKTLPEDIWTTERHPTYPTTDLLLSTINLENVYSSVLRDFMIRNDLPEYIVGSSDEYNNRHSKTIDNARTHALSNL